uniref:DUF4371 domain-containing protein n=1 Tax=Homalodisca liturata TaxID=320908 RepID=A0A1B6JGE6_9HEMI
MSKKPSGAEYRKRKKEEEEKAKKHQKIDLFFKSDISLSKNNDSVRKQITSGLICECSEISSDLPTIETENGTSTQTPPEFTNNEPDVSLDVKINNDSCSCTVDIDKNCVLHIDTNEISQQRGVFKTDIGLYTNDGVSLLKEEDKTFILNSEPCRPTGPFPKDSTNNRSFSSDFYYKIAKTGQKLERFWLCYSPLLNGVYCEPCWLFADRTDPKFKDAWCKGLINDWQGLSKKIKEHETSRIHLNSCLAYSTVKNSQDAKSLIQKYEPEYCEILKRLLDVVITMATCNLAFRGHRNENIETVDTTSGNFLNIIDLLSRYDPLLKSHLENDQSKVKYLSPKIQNEMIMFASQHVLDEVVSEIQAAPFFSLVLDTTQDVSKTDQLSIVIRHVAVQNYEKLEIKESFLGFIALTGQNSEKITNEVCNFLEEENNIKIEKCRGQGYDGAAVMSGNYSGIQSRIKQKSPNAEYVHCASHNLNLVLNDSVTDITEMILFYDLVNQIYVFFGESLPRWQALREKSMEQRGSILSKTLKRLCPTRWSSRYDCLLAIKCNFVSVLSCLTNIILTSKKNKEVLEATGLKKQMTCFQFVLMLTFQSKVLERINITSKTLQKEDVSIDEATALLGKSMTELKRARNEFEGVVKEAETLARGWNIESSLPTKRCKKVKNFFDELTNDVEFSNPLQEFKVKVFYRSLDIVIAQISRRFESMVRINDQFIFLTPKYLTEKSDDELIFSARKFCEKYEEDVSHGLETQIVCFRNIVSDEIKTRGLKKVKDLASYLMIENVTLSSSLPDVCTAMMMFLTLPVTSASAERFVITKIS